MFTFKHFLDVIGVGAAMHISTKDGRGWILANVHADNTSEILDWMLERPVVNIYLHEGREAHGPNCCYLETGIAVVLAGSECGLY